MDTPPLVTFSEFTSKGCEEDTWVSYWMVHVTGDVELVLTTVTLPMVGSCSRASDTCWALDAADSFTVRGRA
jgi:hypothetical protein